MIDITSLFSEGHSDIYPFLISLDTPYKAIPMLHDWIKKIIDTLDKSHYQEIAKDVYVHRSCRIYPYVTILGPTVVKENSEIRPGAFIRGNVLIGKDAVIGNSTEIKNSILFDGVKVPHYNYIGDSILGYNVHFGASSLTSNVKNDKSEVVINDGQNIYPTGLKKLGAIVGDNVEIGCQSVLNPGTIVGPNTRVYPLLSLRGIIPSNVIVKAPSIFVPIKEAH